MLVEYINGLLYEEGEVGVLDEEGEVGWCDKEGGGVCVFVSTGMVWERDRWVCVCVDGERECESMVIRVQGVTGEGGGGSIVRLSLRGCVCVLCVSYVGLLCVFIMCVYYVCVLCVCVIMCVMCVYYVCVLCVCIMCVCYLCVLCVCIMCVLCVCYACVLCVCVNTAINQQRCTYTPVTHTCSLIKHPHTLQQYIKTHRSDPPAPM
eukprot:GHVQ01003698.1.p1 GENE.GHVQ01003698.1~~GHVQ01003698.1.p1  ORF type:complete len:206 (+),score=44.66 GHVQ01003698.1:177-794(+)